MTETATAPESTEATTEPKFTITLPDWQDKDAVSTFMEQLAEHATVRGVKVLTARSQVVLKHMALVAKDITAAQKAVNYINGTRTTLQAKGDGKRSLRYRAKQYFDSLSTAALRQQCELFGVDYDAYERMEDIVAALVDKNVAMQTAAGSNGHSE